MPVNVRSRVYGAADQAPEHGCATPGVLVPTAGGPHATEAIKLASKITQLPDPTCAIEEAGPAGVDALYIEPDIGPESEMVGRRILDKAIKRAVGDKPSEHRVRPIVEIDKEFRNGLTRVVERGGYDLLLVGAANQWHARKALFSMLPNEVLNDEGGLTIGVVRQPKPLMTATAAASASCSAGVSPSLPVKTASRWSKSRAPAGGTSISFAICYHRDRDIGVDAELNRRGHRADRRAAHDAAHRVWIGRGAGQRLFDASCE